MKKSYTLLALLAAAGTAQAALVANWSDPLAQSYADPIDTLSSDNATEIQAIRFVYQGSKLYVRLDIRQDPNPTSTECVYGINIDMDNNLGTGPYTGAQPSWYVPESMTGIDQIYDVHYSWTGPGFVANHDHTYDAFAAPQYFDSNAAGDSGASYAFEDFGTYFAIEFAIPTALLGPAGTYTLYGSTQIVGDMSPWYDVTTGYENVPEPGSLALALVGAGALALRRRFIKK